MTDEPARSRKWSWWKNGCIGCGGLMFVGVALLVVAIVRGNVAPEWKRVELTQPLPSSTGEALEVSLDLSKGEFTIEPAPAGEPLRIEAHYNAALFHLEHEWDEGRRWYRLAFDSKPLVAAVETDRSDRTYVRLFLPRGYPLRLNGKVRIGASRLELGGLALEDVDLELSAGEHVVSFAEPTTTTGKQIAIASSMGQLRIEGLGNASPATAHLRHSAGEARLELGGSWRQDAEIDIGYRAGQVIVTSPGPEVGFEVVGSRVIAGSVSNSVEDRAPPAGAPTVRLRSSGTAGGIEIR